jgi:hypothetical protein
MAVAGVGCVGAWVGRLASQVHGVCVLSLALMFLCMGFSRVCAAQPLYLYPKGCSDLPQLPVCWL